MRRSGHGLRMHSRKHGEEICCAWTTISPLVTLVPDAIPIHWNWFWRAIENWRITNYNYPQLSTVAMQSITFIRDMMPSDAVRGMCCLVCVCVCLRKPMTQHDSTNTRGVIIGFRYSNPGKTQLCDLQVGWLCSWSPKSIASWGLQEAKMTTES